MDAKKSISNRHGVASVARQPSSFIYAGGFTLIELLVVIAVIALLMAILLPCLQRARRQAKAVVCQAHLRQWGQILAAYTDENEGYFPYGLTIAAVWLFRGPMPLAEGDSTFRPLTQPASTDGIRCCPMATGPPIDSGSGTLGFPCGPKGEYAEVTWSPAPTRSGTWKAIRPAPTFVASYGFNAWLLENTCASDSRVRQVPRATNVFSVRGRGAVPVLLDSMWPDRFVFTDDGPPDEEGVMHPRQMNNMASFCLNRHDGYVNGLFLDWSVRKIGLKEIWTLKWRSDFDTAGHWTRAGGVQPGDWPEWMRGFKDY